MIGELTGNKFIRLKILFILPEQSVPTSKKALTDNAELQF